MVSNLIVATMHTRTMVADTAEFITQTDSHTDNAVARTFHITVLPKLTIAIQFACTPNTS
jgi:hypothetical protein